jgi:hypothetical protein
VPSLLAPSFTLCLSVCPSAWCPYPCLQHPCRGTVLSTSLSLRIVSHSFFTSIPSHIYYPLGNHSILAAPSLVILAFASSVSQRCGNLGPSKGRRRTPCEFWAESPSAPHPASLGPRFVLFSGILAAGLWWVLATIDSLGGRRRRITLRRHRPIAVRFVMATFNKRPDEHGCQ